MTSAPRVPDESNSFLRIGHTLLIKGDAGTGKTTLALEILQNFEPVDCIYFSTKLRQAFFMSIILGLRVR
ncbi:MAG: gas vesicle protein GvpD P-loop domain-containing protein [Nitrososphaerales archaeon]